MLEMFVVFADVLEILETVVDPIVSSILWLNSKNAEPTALAMTDESEIHSDIGELENTKRMLGLWSLVIKRPPERAMRKEPDFEKPDFDSTEIDGLHNATSKQTKAKVELSLKFEIDNDIFCWNCDLIWNLTWALLDDVHLVASFAEEMYRVFALESKVPRCEPKTQMVEAPVAAKVMLLNAFNNGPSKEMLLVEFTLNSE